MAEPTIMTITIGLDSTKLLALSGVATIGSTGDNFAQRLQFELSGDLAEKYASYTTMQVQLWTSKESFVPIDFDAASPETWLVDITNRLSAEATLNVQVVFTKDHEDPESVVREASSQLAIKFRSVHNRGETPIEPKPNSWSEFVGEAFTMAQAEGSVITFYNLAGQSAGTVEVTAGTASELSTVTNVNGIAPGKFLAVGPDGHLEGADGGGGGDIPKEAADAIANIRRGENLFNVKAADFGALTASTGVITSDTTKLWQIVPLKPETTYVRNVGPNITNATFFDKNGVIVGYVGLSAGYTPQFTTPANTDYAIIGVTRADSLGFMLEEGTESSPFYIPFRTPIDGIAEKKNIVQKNVPHRSVPLDTYTLKDITSTMPEIPQITLEKISNMDTLTFVSTSTTTSTKIELGYFDVEYGNLIEFLFRARADVVDKTSRAAIRIRYYDDFTQMTEYPDYDINISSTDFQLHRYKCPIPLGVKKVLVILFTYDNVMQFQSFKMTQKSGELSPNGQGIKTVAHLGLHHYAPRNTIPAFELAANMGFWGCITNVGVTKDNQLVCLHDSTIDATSDGTGNVADYTYEELLQFDFGSWFGLAFTGTKIPLLERVLRLFARRGVHPFIRLPSVSDPQDFFTQIDDILHRCGLYGQSSVKAFSFNVLNQAHSFLGEKVRYGFDYEGTTDAEFTQALDNLAAYGEGNAFIDLSFHRITSEMVAEAKSKNLFVSASFLTNLEDIKRMQRMGVLEVQTSVYCLDGCMY